MPVRTYVVGFLLAIALTTGCDSQKKAKVAEITKVQRLEKELRVANDAKKRAELKADQSNRYLRYSILALVGCATLVIGTQLGLNAEVQSPDQYADR